MTNQSKSINERYAERIRQRLHMREVWLKAILNMPWYPSKSIIVQRRHSVLGQIHALADCLEMPMTRVKKSLIHGVTPRDPLKLEILEKLAGPRGTDLAAVRLAALGHLKKYPAWPSHY